MLKFTRANLAKICLCSLFAIPLCQIHAQDVDLEASNDFSAIVSQIQGQAPSIPIIIPPGSPSLIQLSLSPLEFTHAVSNVWNVNASLVIQLLAIQDSLIHGHGTQDQLSKIIDAISINANKTFKNLLKNQNVTNFTQIANYLAIEAMIPLAYYNSLVESSCSTGYTPSQVIEKWESIDESYALLIKQSLPSIKFHDLIENFKKLRIAYIDLISDLDHGHITLEANEITRINKLEQILANQIAIACLK